MLGIQKESWFFGILLVVVTFWFLQWGSGYTNSYYPLVFILATLFAIFMAFNIGGNDVANSFGTSVGAGTLTLKQALIVAAIFEVSGAMIAGGEVTKTIRKGIVDLGPLNIEPMMLVYIMMSALIAAALWLLIATKKALPVSTTPLSGFYSGDQDILTATIRWCSYWPRCLPSLWPSISAVMMWRTHLEPVSVLAH
jgi:inorganic phosphate transporter, PiT family